MAPRLRLPSKCAALASVWVLAGLAPSAAGAQGPNDSIDSPDRTWWISVETGLTDLAADRAAPGSMSMVSMQRVVLPRVLMGVEAGVGFIDRPGLCQVGTAVEFECDKPSWWPTLGISTRVTVYEMSELGLRFHILGQLGGHGPDLIRSYDLGYGMGFVTIRGFEAGFEVRRRFGSVDGSLYFFRLARPLGGSATSPGAN